MTEDKRQRLVGAIVLLCLAVILIPALLDFSPREDPSVPVVSMPDPPARHLAPEVPGIDRALAPRPNPATPPVEWNAKPLVAAEPDPVSSAVIPVQTTEPLASIADTNPAPSLEPPAAGWVVQVGTFANDAGAKAVFDQLREAGLPAFTEKINTPQGTATRVRVGPEFERPTSEAQQVRVKELTGLDAVVLRFP